MITIHFGANVNLNGWCKYIFFLILRLERIEDLRKLSTSTFFFDSGNWLRNRLSVLNKLVWQIVWTKVSSFSFANRIHTTRVWVWEFDKGEEILREKNKKRSRNSIGHRELVHRVKK